MLLEQGDEVNYDWSKLSLIKMYLMKEFANNEDVWIWTWVCVFFKEAIYVL